MTEQVIIGAFSAATGEQYAQRRQTCLDTWIPTVEDLGAMVVFLLGDPALLAADYRPERHELWLPARDQYLFLPQKTREFCRWAIGHQDAPPWTYLFKCDDDTYIHGPRFAAYEPAGRDYIGNEWKAGVRYASGGAGYWLSRRSAEIVAEQLATDPQATPDDPIWSKTSGPEDMAVGALLRSEEIQFHKDPSFEPWGWRPSATPADNPHLITTHAIEDQAMLTVHRRCGF